MNSDQVQNATLAEVLCASVRIDNCRDLCQRYCQLTGMAVYVVWNLLAPHHERFVLLDQGQMNVLALGKPQYQIIFTSEADHWLIAPEKIDPPLGYGHVRNYTQYLRRTFWPESPYTEKP